MFIVGEIIQLRGDDTVIVRRGDVPLSLVDGVDIDLLQLTVHSVQPSWVSSLNVALTVIYVV